MRAKANYNLQSKTGSSLDEVAEEELLASPTRQLSPSPTDLPSPPEILQNGNKVEQNGNGTVQNGNETAAQNGVQNGSNSVEVAAP